jgi:hypothetical protein
MALLSYQGISALGQFPNKLKEGRMEGSYPGHPAA